MAPVLPAAPAPLASVLSVLRLLSPQTLAVEHVVHQLSAFLDVSVSVSLPKAAASGSLRLCERVALRVLADDQLHAALRDHWFARAMEAAIQANDLCMVQQIHRFHPEPLVLLSLRLALEFGSLEIAQWMIEHRHDRLCCASGLENLCRSCWLKALKATSDREVCRVVKWALDQGLPVIIKGEDENKSPLYRAMLLDADFMKWGDENDLLHAASFAEYAQRDGAYCQDPGVALVRRAIQTESTPIEVVRYLIDRQFAPLISEPSLLNSLIAASCQGREQVVECVLSSYLCDSIRDHVTYAPTRPGGAKVFQFGKDPKSISECGVSSTQFSASKHGHIDSLQWLYTTHQVQDLLHISKVDEQNLLQRYGSWHSVDMDTMDCAAAKGHLEIVKWLYEHRRAESCVTTAMISAAVEGELDVLVWLHENTLEGCTTCVLDQLLREPALYAQKPKRRLFPYESEDVPVLNTLRWLRDHAKARPDCARRCFQRPRWGLEWRLSTLAACRGDLQLLAYLHECYSDEFTLPMDHDTVPSALVWDVTMQALGHFRAVRWVFTHYPEAFDWRAVRKAAEYTSIRGYDLEGWLSLAK